MEGKKKRSKVKDCCTEAVIEFPYQVPYLRLEIILLFSRSLHQFETLLLAREADRATKAKGKLVYCTLLPHSLLSYSCCWHFLHTHFSSSKHYFLGMGWDNSFHHLQSQNGSLICIKHLKLQITTFKQPLFQRKLHQPIFISRNDPSWNQFNQFVT